MLQTAEGAMGSMTSMVQRIRELAVQAGDPAYTSNDRARRCAFNFNSHITATKHTLNIIKFCYACAICIYVISV